MNGSAAIRRSLRVVLPLALISFVVGVLLISDASAAPAVVTDKVEYGPNEVVTIDGTGFIGNTDHAVPVIWPDGIVRVWNGSSFVTGYDTVTTDASGAFNYLYQLENMYGMYEVRVYLSPWSGDLSEPAIASTTFLDAIGKSLNHCKNGSLASPIDPCDWHNGNLNGNNSHYGEGQSVPYRGTLTQVPAGATHFLRITYDFTAGGTPAFDYLTRFDLIDSPDPCADLPSGVEASWSSAACPPSGRSTDTGDIPDDTFSAYIEGRSEDGAGPGTCGDATDNGPDGLTDAADPDCSLEVPDTNLAQLDRQIEIRGGTIVDIGDVEDCTVGTSVGASDGVEVSAPEHDGPTTGNSTACVDVEFKADTTGCTADLCTVLILWGGHLAKEDWGDGNGSSSISGAPFHMSYMLDGADGKPDRSIQPGAILAPGTIIVEKQTDPDAAVGNFTFTGDAAGTISDNGTITVANLAPGTYTSTENDPTVTPGGFTLTTISCDDGTSTTPSSGDVGTRTATFKLDPGETVTCTFTNTKQASITVCKDVVPNDTSVWDFTLTGPSPGSVLDLGDGQCHTFTNRTPGSYTLTEATQAGYNTSVSCDSGKGSDTDNDITFTLNAGEDVTCTFTNTKQASITVCKDVVPNDTSVWDFTLTGPSPGSVLDLGDGQCHTFTNRTPGSYTLTEATQAGYNTSVSCDSGKGSDTDNDITFTLNASEDVTCTFTNTEIPGTATLIVIKQVINDDGGTKAASDFTMTINGVTATGGNSFPGAESPGTTRTVTLGSYSISETGPSGYNESQSADCSGTIAAGQTKTCTITNDDVPIVLTMQVFKAADGDDPDSNFEDPEFTSPSSSITYQVILDNDSPVPVTITSLSDDVYDPVTCKDSSDLDVVGQVLAADDGDGAGPPDGGGDETACTFVETAPGSEGATVIDTVTVEFSGSGIATSSDSATVNTTGPGAVGGTVELQVASGSGPGSGSLAGGSATARTYALLGAAIAAGALITAGARYAKRRRLR